MLVLTNASGETQALTTRDSAGVIAVVLLGCGRQLDAMRTSDSSALLMMDDSTAFLITTRASRLLFLGEPKLNQWVCKCSECTMLSSFIDAPRRRA
jgi:uncharacterized protein (DUF1684 family)